ncbi:hypothetical protein T03_2785 [Trichinella britovi]|uniref:Integrase catalytic domain-containing protein n=1 Tax=Trichinella britovi TaxID=45882 RepID=A0A0V1CNU9_TRIBR|nr:hypothetical protein T03_2785 [Trichinella britovi]
MAMAHVAIAASRQAFCILLIIESSFCLLLIVGVASRTSRNLITSLLGVVVRFRCGHDADADVKEMLSLVAVVPADSDMLAFLWTSSVDREPDVYVNQRHVFGATCSPAVANFALREAAKRKDAAIAQIVKEAFYVDDLYWSDDNEDVVIERSQELKTAFREACFELSKWVSNSRNVIETWPMEERASVVKELAGMGNSQLPKVKAVGVAWDCEQDSLTFACRRQGEKAKILSEVLSILTSVFDPLGIVGPCVLKEEWEARWQQWAGDVKVVATVSIPRWYGLDRGKPSTMHVFVDAATVGYGSVAYLAQGRTTAFVSAKSRVVNPLMTTTVPRLELQAFIVGVRLTDTLLKELENRLVMGRVVFWSDSPVDRHVEVRYVPSKENPADLISRGMDATGLIKRFDFWTTGPKFLKKEEEWPETKVKPPDNDLELRPKALAFLVGSNSADADKVAMRLTNEEFLSEEMKNPIVMPRKHPVTRLVIRSTHNDVGHLGVNSTKAELGRRFAGRTVRLLCRFQLHRYMSTVCSIEDSHLSCVEWTLLVHLSPPGSRKGGVSFSCASQQELFISTNVESFLLALERFIQRCGKPQSILSDQGTSFVKAAKEQDKSVKALAEELECQKILMSTVESVERLHQEAFRTLIVRVEGILNRRPITIDENGHSVCPMDIVSPGNKETQGFPREASTLEVLRQVRQAAQRSGDTVLLKEGSNPLVDSYITAKVVEVFRSNDGYVRSAMLKTANGKEVVRDIRRISIMKGPALERMKMPVVPPASGGVSHPELDKKGCGGAVWTNLDVTTMIKRNDHIESCPVDEHLAYKMEKRAVLAQRSAEETKPILAIYDEEASAASPSHQHLAIFLSLDGHILVFATGTNIRLLAACRTWGIDKAAVLEVDLNPDTIICDFETALIPAIRGYFPNTRVQGCYFHFCQAVHRKVECSWPPFSSLYRMVIRVLACLKQALRDNLKVVFYRVPIWEYCTLQCFHESQTVTQYYHDIEQLMIYWETYLVKSFATLNNDFCSFLRTVQRPCVLDCRKCPLLMDRKAVFEEKLRALIKEKGHNGTIFPASQRDQIITDILRIQSDGPKYPELKLVTGRPRHPQSQGAVERLNGVVQDKLAIWIRENECKICSVTFGEEPRIGLESYVLPKSLVAAAKTEEEIEEFLTSHEANDEESLNSDGKNYEENESLKAMKHFPETFIKARKEAASGQTRAAAKMTRRSKKMLIPLQIVVVMAECEGLYTVGCRERKLASKFTAADLQVISENLLSIDEAPDAEIPLRTELLLMVECMGIYSAALCMLTGSDDFCGIKQANTRITMRYREENGGQEHSDFSSCFFMLAISRFQSQLTDFPMYRLAEVEVAALYPRIREVTPNCSSVMVQDKKVCEAGVTTNLDVSAVIRRTPHVDDCQVDEHKDYRMEKRAILKKRSAEEPKTIPLIYDEEGAAASLSYPHPASFHFLEKLKRSSRLNHPLLSRNPAAGSIKEINDNAAIHVVKRNPESIIHDFETALIPAIQGYFLNTQVQGCYFHFCQAVHRKVGELGLKTRYRQHEQTRRKIRMLLATAFLPVPHVNTGIRLLEACTTGRITTWKEFLELLIAEQGVMHTVCQQALSGNLTVGNLRLFNKVYVQKLRQVAQYTGEYTNGRRTLEQFLEALMTSSERDTKSGTGDCVRCGCYSDFVISSLLFTLFCVLFNKDFTSRDGLKSRSADERYMFETRSAKKCGEVNEEVGGNEAPLANSLSQTVCAIPVTWSFNHLGLTGILFGKLGCGFVGVIYSFCRRCVPVEGWFRSSVLIGAGGRIAAFEGLILSLF